MLFDFLLWLARPRSRVQAALGSIIIALIMLSPLWLIGLGIWIGAYLGHHW